MHRLTICVTGLMLGGFLLLPGFSQQEAQYPKSVTDRLEGKQPFASDAAGSHGLRLKPLFSAQHGTYGFAMEMDIEGLGKRLLLLDTAGRGLALKIKPGAIGETIHVPEWSSPGPGIQTGIFRLFPKLSAQNLTFAPVVAELFWEKGFQWIDGIISTEIFKRWIVRLDFKNKKLILLPREDYIPRADREWTCSRDGNWWFVTAEIQDRPAWLLLDSGAGRTVLAASWLQSGSSQVSPRQHLPSDKPDFYEAGDGRISIGGQPSIRKRIQGANDAQIPKVPGITCHGLLGCDVLRELSIDLDYRASKIYLR